LPVSACQRSGRVRCDVGWRYRESLVFEGRAAVRYRRNNRGQVRWWYAYSIAETDEECPAEGCSEAECVIVHDV
jgi:hypothetical protein